MRDNIIPGLLELGRIECFFFLLSLIPRLHMNHLKLETRQIIEYIKITF